MRNLIGRLNARSQTDLDRIAVAWRMIITAPDKAGTVAQVIRTLTDIRAVRDAWWSLDDNDRALLSVLSEAREPMAIESIAAATKTNEADTRSAATRSAAKRIGSPPGPSARQRAATAPGGGRRPAK